MPVANEQRRNFVAGEEWELAEKMAAEEERSVSNFLRRLIRAEYDRRKRLKKDRSRAR